MGTTITIADIKGFVVRRGLQLSLWAIGLALTAALVSQCTPSPGCYSDNQLYRQGSHLGFQVGMSTEAASRILEQRFGLKSVTITDAAGDSHKEMLVSRAGSSVAPPAVEYWWLPHRPPLCWSHERAIRLTFRGGVLTAILDDADITYP